MAASVLAHAARRQGRQGLLAWRAAAAEAQAAPQLLQGAGQQGQGQVLPWQGPADAEVPQQQWAGSRRSLHTAAGPSSGIAAAAAATAGSAASPAALAAGLFAASQASSAASLWLAQQRRGMALNFSRYQPRRKPQEDRNLPEKNEQIRAKEVRVLFPDPDQPSEVMPTKQALKLARQQEMDLVMVTPRADPPVVRITDWSKVVYESQKREKAAAKQALAQRRAADPKEVRFSCQIGEHDLGVKMAQARKFLEDGNLLRLVVLFKGGQQIALGHEVTLYLIGQLADLARVKDEKHLQRPQRGQWAVMLEPLPPEKPTKKKDKPEAAAAAAAAPLDGAAEQEPAAQAAVQEQQAGAAAQ